MLLKNELLGAQYDNMKCQSPGSPPAERGPAAGSDGGVLSFKRSPRQPSGLSKAESPFSLSPVGADSQRLLRSPSRASRKISKVPFKVLDAPELQDDFYLNLVDWSSQNVLCVGLGSCVYLWSACTSQVTKLCDLGDDPVRFAVRAELRCAHGTTASLSTWDAER